MASLFQSGMYSAINTADNTTNGFYAIQFISEAYRIQKNTTIDGQVISTSELVVKAQCIFSMQENTNWYWKKTTTETDHHSPNTHNTSSTS